MEIEVEEGAARRFLCDQLKRRILIGARPQNRGANRPETFSDLYCREIVVLNHENAYTGQIDSQKIRRAGHKWALEIAFIHQLYAVFDGEIFSAG